MHAYEMELKNCPYQKASLCCGKMDPEFVTWLQTACDAIVRAPRPQPIAVPQQYLSFLPAENVLKIRLSTKYPFQFEKRMKEFSLIDFLRDTLGIAC